jgi:hypothetical protein
VKLFQIEEPEGGPADPNAAGAAIGIDASGRLAEVAFSVGGNGLVLSDRGGFEQVLSVPGAAAIGPEWQELFGNAKVRAERALARPVTHAVVVVAPELAKYTDRLRDAAREAGLEVLRFLAASELPSGSVPVLAAALIAEDLAPRQEPGG